MKWKTRKAVKTDEPRIRELFIEMLQTIYSTNDVDGYEDGYLDKFFGGHEDWVCVAEVNDSVVAYLSIEVHHEEENFIYLDDLSVSAKYRSHGIGTSLIKTAEEFAHIQNIPAIVFHVEKSNEGARKLYKRLGYSVMNEEKTRFRMIKRFPRNAISEAGEIVKSRLNISHPKKNVNILTKGGSLCFYGDWFGRPYDNYHQIIHTSYDGEILEIIFDQHEHLLVYQPEGITSTERELMIAKAQKVKWLYIPYGSKTTKHNTITYTYTADSETVSKETKYGMEHLRIKEPFCAVHMARY